MHTDPSEIRLVVADVDGTLTDGGIYMTEKGDHFKRFHARDGLGAKLLRRKGYLFALLSHSLAPQVVLDRAKMLGCDLVHVGREPKLETLRQWCQQLGIELRQVAYIGDDLNDLEAMRAVGFTACPADAIEAVRQEAHVVLRQGGGQAAFREWLDRYFLDPTPQAQNPWT